MQKVSHRIVGTGLFALDVLVDPDGTVGKSSLGGSAGNVLAILASLGWQSVPVIALGEDAAAQKVRNDFEAAGADTKFLRHIEGRATPVIYQHQLAADEGGTHRFTFACPSCGERRRPSWGEDEMFDEVVEDLPEASVFFLDRPTRLGVKLAEHYFRRGAFVLFEPSAVGDDPLLFSQALKVSHIVKYADDRISDLTDFDLGAVAVEIQTLGRHGLRFRAPSLDDAWLSLAAYDLPHVQDTAGAGDWCTAGLLHELFRGGFVVSERANYNELAQALAFGQALSTLNCMTQGARGLLDEWTPSTIVRCARSMCETRLGQMYRDCKGAVGPVAEPRLVEFAQRLAATAKRPSTRSDANRLWCCTPS